MKIGTKVKVVDREGNQMHVGVVVELSTTFARVYNDKSDITIYTSEWFPLVRCYEQ
jgi:hypothetical protein